eukprot:TRINITY_DN4493_c0_g1::TRINITY_DN4493_c0_g1_i1::g.7317::m.7317 TRINITY_DN4493_c0_g1::TRINITY_DN4493_c0_g1_i1::g.7317  ORF type:complete len:540 (-),score=17.64,sp/Q9ZWB7/PCS2_ARATH/36.77/3e-70,Phytochelatin/PF05023.9/1.2e-75,Peptidase_C39_2/PF13529.1/0.15 TRINITY_DN4493_c0_g1_i1:108-1727(-)
MQRRFTRFFSLPIEKFCITKSIQDCPTFRKRPLLHLSHPPSPKPVHMDPNPSTVTSFYRRPLPSSLISLSSKEGEQMFREVLIQECCSKPALQLLSHYVTQSEPAYCGLASLAMVLNALEIDPGRIWKGPWRWFSEELLDCCTPLEKVKVDGVTMGEFVRLAVCNGAEATQFFGDSFTEDEFRQEIIRVANSSELFMVVSYCRTSLGQTGIGHFSPVAAYHAKSDKALVLDVARFKYPPYWVDVRTLYESLLPVDPTTERSRGYILVRRSTVAPLVFCRLSLYKCSWAHTFRFIYYSLPQQLAAIPDHKPHHTTAKVTNSADGSGTASQCTIPDASMGSCADRELMFVLHAVLGSLPVGFGNLIRTITEDVSGDIPVEHKELIATIASALETTRLFHLVGKVVQDGVQLPAHWRPHSTHMAALLLFSLPDMVFSPLAPNLKVIWNALRTEAIPPELRSEIEALRSQLEQLSTLIPDEKLLQCSGSHDDHQIPHPRPIVQHDARPSCCKKGEIQPADDSNTSGSSTNADSRICPHCRRPF